MYNEFYGFTRIPFHVTPDPASLFLSRAHKDSVGAILYGIAARKGFIAVTGDAGVGKTTALRYCLCQLDQERHDIIYLVQPALAPPEFYKLLYRELFGRRPPRRHGIEMEVSAVVAAIHRRLFRAFDQQKSVVVVIDEAQNMPIETLEALRVLSNLETNTDKLLQIILVGQTELEEKLARHELRQLDQRIAVRARIPTLSSIEALHYIAHRTALAGGTMAEVFTHGALWTLIAAARGNARRLTIYCDNALMNGYGYGARRVSRHVAREAVHQFGASTWRGSVWATGSRVVAAVAAAIPMLRYAISIRGTGGAHLRGDDELFHNLVPRHPHHDDRPRRSHCLTTPSAPTRPEFLAAWNWHLPWISVRSLGATPTTLFAGGRHPVRLTAVVLIMLLSHSYSSRAAPYCLESYGVPPQCVYSDTRDCYREARRVKGNCTYNPAEISLPAYGAGRFCMVLNGPILECVYLERRYCDAQALSRGGICIDRTPEQRDVDIFRR